MNKWELSGVSKPITTVSNPSFHLKILERNSPGKNNCFGFPLLFFREGSADSFVWGSKLSFPIHFHFLRHIISPIVSLIFIKTRTDKVYNEVPDTESGINRSESTFNTKIYGIQASPVAGDSALLSGKRNQIPNSKALSGNRISERSFRILFPAKGEILNLNKKSSKSTIFGKTLPNGNGVSEITSALYTTAFSGLTVNLKSQLIFPSSSVYNSGSILEKFPENEFYHQASGKELIFNSVIGIAQELEREVEMIKEKLFQAEKISQANYSSIYSKMEEELNQKFEINRISELVIQQIVWRLKIEKERRGIL